MKYTNKQIAKAIIRELKFAREIKKIVNEGEGGAPEEEEETAAADASTEPDAEVEEPTEEPTEEPQEEPTEEPAEEEEEEGAEEELTDLTDMYIKKLRNSQVTIEQSDVVELMSMIIDGFGYGNQDKLSVLQGIKETSIR
tara:strand:- start:353 stop:772 length:420 start_codon:yes stop_codon:yes gene_type:complete